jgi:hypothetical protein
MRWIISLRVSRHAYRWLRALSRHKFDPIPTADYYAIYGILHSTKYAEPGDDAVRYRKTSPIAIPKRSSVNWKIFQQQLKPIQGAIDAVLKLPALR